jgi:hypothetical protein
VKPYVKRGKSDATDAAAICEVVATQGQEEGQRLHAPPPDTRPHLTKPRSRQKRSCQAGAIHTGQREPGSPLPCSA